MYKSKALKIGVLALVLIALTSSFANAVTFVERTCYPSGSLDSGESDENNLACGKDWIKVKVESVVPSSRILYIKVTQRHHDDPNDIHYTLYTGYLSLGQETPQIYTQGINDFQSLPGHRYWDQVWVEIKNLYDPISYYCVKVTSWEIQ